jgi:tRNA1(Val) A37 N6-methylase TrmN6
MDSEASRPEASRPLEPGAAEPTWDSVLDGSVRFLQPAHGYRVNQDSVMLAAFAARGRPAELAVDLGAGVGVVGLVLARLGFARALALVEREPALVALARRNLEALSVPGEVFERDLAQGLPVELVNRAAIVLANPPFFTDERHQSEDPGARSARHGPLEPFLEAARVALAGERARAALAYPARALHELLEAARRARLGPRRLRLVHAFVDRPARLALVELRLGQSSALLVEPPWIEWERPGVPTPELAALSAPRAVDRT